MLLVSIFKLQQILVIYTLLKNTFFTAIFEGKDPLQNGTIKLSLAEVSNKPLIN